MFVMLQQPNEINRYQVGFFTPGREATPPSGKVKGTPRVPVAFQAVYHNINSEDAAHVVSFLNGGALSDIANAQINAANLAGEHFRTQFQAAMVQDAAETVKAEEPAVDAGGRTGQ